MTVLIKTASTDLEFLGYPGRSYVEELTFLNGDDIELGDAVHFNRGCYLNGAGGITIGDRSVFGPYCAIHSANHTGDPERGVLTGCEPRPVSIGEGVWCGCHVVILPGAVIGDRAIIGGGAVVSGEIPAGAFAAGNPARVIRERAWQ